ncbi:MAG TPA: glycerol-3-phosphate 1-O-acyltransferase PlsY [Acidimicrobiia bacterium]
MGQVIALVGAYLLGSLDWAVVVGRMHGVDIHSVGSGNPGTSNVLRTLGRGPAAMVLAGDMMKGVIAAAVGWWAGGLGDPASAPWAYAAVLAAVVGHSYPVFHRFKGGKGVATAGGGLVFIIPIASLGLAATWVVLAKATKVASISSLAVVGLSIPAALVSGARGWALVWLAATVVLIVWRHRPNIERMIKGSEQRVPT